LTRLERRDRRRDDRKRGRPVEGSTGCGRARKEVVMAKAKALQFADTVSDAPFIFDGTIDKLNAATMPGIASETTAIVSIAGADYNVWATGEGSYVSFTLQAR